MNYGASRWPLLAVGAMVGYLVTMSTNPAHTSLEAGLRCLRRYKQLWLIPAVFAVAHAGFEIGTPFLQPAGTFDTVSLLKPWTGWHPPGWTGILTECLLPAAESTSAIFNCILTAFPLSAVGAVLFLCNWRGYQADVFRGLRRRCGKIGGATMHFFLTICALAALCKPVIFGGLPSLQSSLSEPTLLRGGELINAFSFFFEYLLGVSVQIYLILLSFAWIRGLTFDFDGLRRLALRRFAVVLKWTALILAISSLGINLPLILASFQTSSSPWQPAGFIHGGRWWLSVVLLVFCSTQVLLVLHNEPIGRAVEDSARLWKQHGWQAGWMVVIAGFHFFLLAVANTFLPQALGRSTWPTGAWNLFVYPLVWSGFAGWFLASWVCLIRSFERPGLNRGEWVRF